jgi:hypothetical protein
VLVAVNGEPMKPMRLRPSDQRAPLPREAFTLGSAPQARDHAW